MTHLPFYLVGNIRSRVHLNVTLWKRHPNLFQWTYNNNLIESIVCKLLAKDSLGGGNQNGCDSSWTDLIIYRKVTVSLRQEDSREK